MPKSLMVLVAATCVVIIAAAGVWGFGQYSSYQKAQDVEVREATRAACTQALGHLKDALASTRQTVADCVSAGYLTQNDVAKSLGMNF